MFNAPTTATKRTGAGARTPVSQPALQPKRQPGEVPVNSIAELQRTIGNQAVLGMLRGVGRPSSGPARTGARYEDAGARVIQRSPDDDDSEEALVEKGVTSCPGGAMPYMGVCLTDEILEELPATGDPHAAVRAVEAKRQETRAQTAIQEKFAKISNVALSEKIGRMHAEVKGSGRPDLVPASLRRLEKERERRRAERISDPTTVDRAVAMLEEAWSLAEKEDPPDMLRAKYLLHVVNRWMQKAAPASRYDECFSGFSRTIAMQTVGPAKGNIASLETKLRNGWGIGGWWEATINSLRVARELIQIMSGEKRMEETEFNAISKTINKTAVATPLVGMGIIVAPAVLMTGAELIPAGLEFAEWAAVRAVPRLATWIGMHPFLSAEIGGAVLNVGGKIAEGDLTPEDITWTILSLGHANMQDASMNRPPGSSPARAPNRVGAAFVLGLDNAEILPKFSAGGTTANRPVPAIVAGAPPTADIGENMPAPTRPTVPTVSDVGPNAQATPTSAPTAAPTPTTTVTPAPTVTPATTPRPVPTTQPMRLTSADPLPTRSATLKTIIRSQRPDLQVTALPRSSTALSGDAAASVTPDTPAPARTARVRANTLPFLQDQLAKVSNPSHTLHNALVVPVVDANDNLILDADGHPTFTWRTTTFTAKSGRVMTGRYEGSEHGIVVQVGHREAFASGAPEVFMLEDADANQWGGQTIESRGSLSTKIAVEVEGVPVDLFSLQWWEGIGAVPKGTVAKAKK